MKIPRLGKKTLIISAVAAVVLALPISVYMFPAILPKPVAAVLAKIGIAPRVNEVVSAAKAAENQDWALENFDPVIAQTDPLQVNVRKMVAELEGMAQGTPSAVDDLQVTMHDIQELLTHRGEVPANMNQSDTTSIYLLSGGSAKAIADTIKTGSLSTRQRVLLEATLAYVRGDLKAASGYLRSIDPSAFPGPIAARILMMQVKANPELTYQARRSMLASAADLALGSLAEEAATRRLVALAAANAATEDFNYWAIRYARRFPNSYYYDEYLASLTQALSSFESHKTPLPQETLDRVIAVLPKDRRLNTVEVLQAAALRSGYSDLCKRMWSLAKADLSGTSQQSKHVDLYEVACRVGKQAISSDELAQFKEADLLPADKALFEALQSLIAGIAGSVEKVNEPEPQAYGPVMPYANALHVKELETMVSQQLSKTDKLLKAIEQ